MNILWYIILLLRFVFVNCEERFLSFKSNPSSQSSIKYQRSNNRLFSPSSSKQSKQSLVEKRQVYSQDGINHIFVHAPHLGVNEDHFKDREKQLDSSQPTQHFEDSLSSNIAPNHYGTSQLFNKPQTSFSNYEIGADSHSRAVEEGGNLSPIDLHSNEATSLHLNQDPSFSNENREGDTQKELPQGEQINNFASQERLPDEQQKDLSSVESSQEVYPQQEQRGLFQDQHEPSSTVNINDHVVKNISPETQHIYEDSSKSLRSDDTASISIPPRSNNDPFPTLSSPNQEPVIPNTAIPNIRMVKKFYPVEIIQKVPRPIPVTHTKFFPVPVHRKVYRYYPRPFPRLFSEKPDVHVSYLHYEKRANPCQHGGIIVQSPGGYTCLCRKAYKGKHCQEKDQCYPYPCKNDGDCVDHGSHYECKCTKGFKGINCDVKDKCYRHPCKNGGTCIQINHDVKCSCEPGYKGQFCEGIDLCHPNPCRNGGSCHEFNLDASCACTAFYKGPRCQVPRTCTPNLCRNGGVCVEEKPSAPCQCSSGYTGVHCTQNVCEPNPCKNDGVCYSSKSDYNNTWNAECKCHGTFKGQWCQIANPCSSNPSPCVHGICYDAYTTLDHVSLDENGFTCHCYEGYFGINCAEKKCNHCDTKARCVNGQCVCNDGYQGDGYNCKKIPDLCIPNPCENGGICHSDFDSFECQCAPGFKGKHCHVRTPCSILDNPCKNGGTCIEEDDSYHCICPNGVKGDDCSNNSTTLCDSHPCLNGGTCKVSEDNKSWYCVCRSPHFKPPDCACNCPAKAKLHSERNLICDNQEGLCMCPQGFTLNNKRDVCVDDDRPIRGKTAISCTPNPCKNDGVCVTLSHSRLLCMCKNGWTGRRCEEEVPLQLRGQSSPCEPNPCKNSGTCTIINGKGVCICSVGFKPPFCEEKEISPCLPNPCQNNGRCMVVGKSYDCICDHQFTGPNCQVDRCLKCDQDNSLCIDGKCICKSGFIGNGYQCSPIRKKVINICIKCHPTNAICANNSCQCINGFVGNGYQCSVSHSDISNQSNNAEIPWFKRSV